MTQNNLAAAYSERIRGDKAENLEQAISAYKEALKVYTFADFPQDWAMTRNNLATAYSERIRGNKAENLEYAIIAYQEVLKVYTFADFPKNWAMTQNNLANAYPNRIRGEKAENLEMAIASLNLSLEVYTRDSFPYEWARSQNNLGSAYKNRIKGDIAENLETAIFCYQEALKIRTFDAFPLDWATTQNNLGNAYSNRIRGNKAENIENAITCHQNALQIYTREAFPADWVKTQYNLANILRERFKLLGKLEDIQQAINAYKQAREIIETTEDKTLYFNYSYQLGKALFEGGYYTEAIEHLESCQQSYQKQKNISSLAPILLELARLYHRTGRLEQARLYFKDSLRLFRRLGDQDNVASVTSALGNLEIQIGKIPQACSHLKEAQEYYQQNNNTERLDEINHLLKILQSA
jgi:tetratricopeptide (TPR) repeat protein